jgi:hypothetical protein
MERIGGVEGGVIKVVGKIGREKSCCEVSNLMSEVSYLAKDPVNAARELAN